MMDRPPQQFSINSRVRLRDGVDPTFYNGYTRTGNEGWVRKIKYDKYGYPRILVEWDKDHWSYNGAQDTWTWEGHFEAVEGDLMTDKSQDRQEAVREVTSAFVKNLFEALGVEGAQTADQDLAQPVQEETPEEDWATSANTAAQTVADSCAFIVIAVKEDEETGCVVPHFFHDAQKEDFSLVCQSQLAHISSMFQDSLISEELQRLARKPNEDE